MKKLIYILLMLFISCATVVAADNDITEECPSAEGFTTTDPNPSLICAETCADACNSAFEKAGDLSDQEDWGPVVPGCTAFYNDCNTSYVGSVAASEQISCDDNGQCEYDFYTWYYFAKNSCEDVDKDGNCDDDDDCECEGGNKQCPEDKVADPIKILSGNHIEEEVDLRFETPFKDGFKFLRKYKSRYSGDSTIGFGWSPNHRVTIKLFERGQGVRYMIKDGTLHNHQFYDADEDGIYDPIHNTSDGVLIEASDGSLIWHRGSGIKYRFDNSLKFVAKEDGLGNIQSINWGDNHIESITDHASGRSMGFVYNTDGKIDYITGPVTPAVPDGIWVRYYVSFRQACLLS